MKSHKEHASRTHYSIPEHLPVNLWNTTRSSSATIQFTRLMWSLCMPRIFARCWDVRGGHLGLKLFPRWTATIVVRNRHGPFLHWRRSGPRGWFSWLNTSPGFSPSMVAYLGRNWSMWRLQTGPLGITRTWTLRLPCFFTTGVPKPG